jgi:MFS family permease
MGLMPKSIKTAVQRHLSHAANDLFWVVLPLVLPLLVVKYKLNYAGAGRIVSFYMAITAVGSYFLGRISDGIPRRYIMGFGFFFAAGGLIAAGFAGSFFFFMFFLAVTAMGMSTYHPAMYAHIDETFKENKGRILGRYEASGGAAILMMFLVNGALVSTIGIRGVMLVTAVPALVMGAVLIGARGIDRDSAGVAGDSRNSPAAGDIGEETVRTDTAGTRAAAALFFVFLLSVLLRVVSITGVLNFLPTIFTDHFGLPLNRASWATGLFFAGGLTGSLIASRYSRADRSFKILLYGSLLIAPLIAVIALIADGPALVISLVPVFLMGVFSAGVGVNQNLILTTMGSRFGRGEAFGILIAVNTLASSASPYLFGLIIDSWGFSRALLVFSVPVVVSTFILIMLSGQILSLTAGGRKRILQSDKLVN